VTVSQPLARRTYVERQTCVQTYSKIALVIFAPTSHDHCLTGGIGEAAAAKSAAKFASVLSVEKSHLSVAGSPSNWRSCAGIHRRRGTCLPSAIIAYTRVQLEAELLFLARLTA
jgi:hypothetical protein